MGGQSESKQTQTSQTQPYAPAQPIIDRALQGLGAVANTAGSLTGAQSGALDTIEANAAKGNPFAGAIGDTVTGLLNGGGAKANDDATKGLLTRYQQALDSIAGGSQIGANSALQPYLDAAKSDVTNAVNGQFAAAGRDFSPANSQALARGWATGTAPIIASQYNTDVQRTMDANAALYGAGNTTYGLLNQNRAAANANAQAGAALAPAALDAGNWQANTILQAEALRAGIPMQNLTTLLGSVSPIAQMFGTQNGTTTGSQTMSGADQFMKIAQGVGSLAGAINPGSKSAIKPR